MKKSKCLGLAKENACFALSQSLAFTIQLHSVWCKPGSQCLSYFRRPGAPREKRADDQTPLLQGWHQCFQLFLTADTTYKIYFVFSFDSLFAAPLALGNQRVTQITTGKLHFFIVLFIKKRLLKIKNYKFYGSATADCILLLRLSVE